MCRCLIHVKIAIVQPSCAPSYVVVVVVVVVSFVRDFQKPPDAVGASKTPPQTLNQHQQHHLYVYNDADAANPITMAYSASMRLSN